MSVIGRHQAVRLLTGRLRLFAINGIEVCIHWLYWFFPVGTFLWYGWMRGRMRGPGLIFGILVFLVILAISVLFHEYCHCLVARKYTSQKKISIVLIPFGALALFEKLPSSPLKEFAIAVAGPLGSVALGGMAWLASLAVKGCHLHHTTVGWNALQLISLMATLNFFVAAFNMLLLVFPADGGRICRALLHGILRRFSRLDAAGAHIMATKLVVRGGWAVSLIVFCAMLFSEIIIFPLFILLPLLCIAGEVELFILKDDYNSPAVETTDEKALYF